MSPSLVNLSRAARMSLFSWGVPCRMSMTAAFHSPRSSAAPTLHPSATVKTQTEHRFPSYSSIRHSVLWWSGSDVRRTGGQRVSTNATENVWQARLVRPSPCVCVWGGGYVLGSRQQYSAHAGTACISGHIHSHCHNTPCALCGIGVVNQPAGHCIMQR